jgi:hypothetical protein
MNKNERKKRIENEKRKEERKENEKEKELYMHHSDAH